jgi:Vault protein inter-alpha-trypsin domain
MDPKIDITGLTSRVELTQDFVNTFDVPLGASYVFPLPDRGAVTAMLMTADGRLVAAELREREAARQAYDTAIATGRRAAIAEERPDVFTMRVGNVFSCDRYQSERLCSCAKSGSHLRHIASRRRRVSTARRSLMAQDGRLRFALTLVEGRLHKAVGDKRCGCGQCSHWIAFAAQRSGVTRERLEAALPPPAKPERRRSQPRRPGVRICDSATVRVRGRDVDPQEGLALLLERLHHPE